MLFAIVVGIPLGILAALTAELRRRLHHDGLRERRLRAPELPDRDVAHLLLRRQTEGSHGLTDQRLGAVAIRGSCPRSRSAICADDHTSPDSSAARCSRRCSRTTSAPRRPRAFAGGVVVGKHVLRNSLIPGGDRRRPAPRLPHHRFVHHRDDLRHSRDRQVLRHPVFARDYSVVMGITVLLAVIIIVANLVRRHPLRLPRSAHAGRAAPDGHRSSASAFEATHRRRAEFEEALTRTAEARGNRGRRGTRYARRCGRTP